MTAGQPVEYRAALKDNVFFVASMNAVVAFFAIVAVIGHAWDRGLGPVLILAVGVLWFGVWPWAYLARAAVWLDDANLQAVDRLFRTREVPRAEIRRVAGIPGSILFIGAGDRVLLRLARFLNDDQVRAIAAQLGLKAEGMAKGLGPL